MDATVKDAQIEAWVAGHRGWTYEIDHVGYHVVRDPLGELKARNADPVIAMEILERR